MTEARDVQLGSLFEKYRKRKAREEHNSKAKREADEKWRQDSGVFLRTTLLPVVQRFAERIRAEGCEAAVEQHLEGFLWPSIQLSIRPVPNELSGELQPNPSSISFICQPPKQVVVKKKVEGRSEGLSSRRYGDENSKPQDEVTESWVEHQLIKFVEQSLDAN